MAYLSNGYLRLGAPISAVVRGATSVDWSSEKNSADVITLVGDVGATNGVRMARVTVRNAVAQTATERRRIVQAYERGDTITAHYRSGNDEFTMTGTIKNFTNSDNVNQPTEFNFELSGRELPVQAV